MWADQTLKKLLSDYEFQTVIDVGSGIGEHKRALRRAGKSVIELDWSRGQLYEATSLVPADCIWASHVLEHMHNVGVALEKMRRDLRPGGVLAITVPPMKNEIVGGHVSLWNAGLLLYRLILAGFDCSRAAVKTYGYNVSVIVERRDLKLPRLAHDEGDIEKLADFFPLPVKQGFDGFIEELNW